MKHWTTWALHSGHSGPRTSSIGHSVFEMWSLMWGKWLIHAKWVYFHLLLQLQTNWCSHQWPRPPFNCFDPSNVIVCNYSHNAAQLSPLVLSCSQSLNWPSCTTCQKLWKNQAGTTTSLWNVNFGSVYKCIWIETGQRMQWNKHLMKHVHVLSTVWEVAKRS